MSDLPRLLIVSGAPATGKTTLARTLAAQLGLTLLVKDELKEAIADALGPPDDVEASQRLGSAAYHVLFSVSRRLLNARAGLVIESNFRRGTSERELLPLVQAADARLVHCTAVAATVRRRYDDRDRHGARHVVHLDAARAHDLASELAMGRYEPLDLDIPTLVVKTDDGYDPSLDALLTFARGRALVGTSV